MEFLDELRFLKEQLKFKEKIDGANKFNEVVLAGMGGSGIAGKIFQEIYTKKPFFVIDDYNIPDFVSKKTLFIGISFSGNTEETLSCTKQAESKGAHIVTISAGGALAEHGDQHIRIPRKDLQPRSSTGYMLMPLLNSFGMASKKEIDDAYKSLAALDKDNKKCAVHAKHIFASDRIPVIFGSYPYKSMAYRWKTQFNENSKVIAYSNSFPELNHNDTLALKYTSNKSKYYFLVIKNKNERIAKRIAVTSEITDTPFDIIEPKGKSTIERLFYTLHYGDYISYHLGKLRGLDIADVTLISTLKERLAK